MAYLKKESQNDFINVQRLHCYRHCKDLYMLLLCCFYYILDPSLILNFKSKIRNKHKRFIKIKHYKEENTCYCVLNIKENRL